MKKVIALLLVVLSVCSGCMFSSFAEESEEPVKTASGYYIGQQIKPGDQLKSSFSTCTNFAIIYYIDMEDAENVTSDWQKKFCDETVTTVSFRDSSIEFQEDEAYHGVYTVKGQGDVVREMETSYRAYKNAEDIYASLSDNTRIVMRMRKPFDLTIDYDYVHTTRNQYTTITAWEIVAVQDDEDMLSFRVKAVFETREPTSFEAFQEKVHTRWMAFLDKLGDWLLKIVPGFFAFWAKVLGKNR